MQKKNNIQINTLNYFRIQFIEKLHVNKVTAIAHIQSLCVCVKMRFVTWIISMLVVWLWSNSSCVLCQIIFYSYFQAKNVQHNQCAISSTYNIQYQITHKSIQKFIQSNRVLSGNFHCQSLCISFFFFSLYLSLSLPLFVYISNSK